MVFDGFTIMYLGVELDSKIHDGKIIKNQWFLIGFRVWSGATWALFSTILAKIAAILADRSLKLDAS